MAFSHLPPTCLQGLSDEGGTYSLDPRRQQLLGRGGQEGWLRLEAAFARRLSAWEYLDIEAVGGSAVLYSEARNVNYWG